jgi:hypothetical protein
MKDRSSQFAALAKRNGGDTRVPVAEAPSIARVAAASSVEPTPSAPLSTVASPLVVAELPPLPARVQPIPVRAPEQIFMGGAFSVQGNAQPVQSGIASLRSVQLKTASFNGIQMYRVRLKPPASADKLLARVVASGDPEVRIIVD